MWPLRKSYNYVVHLSSGDRVIVKGVKKLTFTINKETGKLDTYEFKFHTNYSPIDFISILDIIAISRL